MTLTLGRGNGIIIGNPGGITLATSAGALTVGGAGGVALRQGDPLRLSGGDVVGVPGPAGPPGPAAAVVTVEAATNLNALTIVRVMPDGTARPASSAEHDDADGATGITTAAALAGERVPIRTSGTVVTTTDLPLGALYLNVDGSLTTDNSTGIFELQVGFAPAPRLLIVRFETPIFFEE